MHRRLVRPACLAAPVVALALVAGGPAQAQTDEAVAPGGHRGAATSTALHVSILGEELTVGLTDVRTASSPRSLAHAIGALVPQIGSQTEQTAETTTDGETVTGTETCGPIALPTDLPVVDLATACSAVEATITGGDPGARARGQVEHLGISATDLLGTLGDLGLPVEETVEDAVGELLAGLAPVLQAAEPLGLDAESLVRDLLDAITDGGDLVSIDLGPAVSSITTGADALDVAGTAAGAIVTVLDRSLLQLPPVLTIEVGAAASRATADRATGTATPVIDPALVRITIAEDVATALGLPADPIEVAPGQEVCLGLPAPLDSCISVAAGRTSTTADGGARAESEGVGLRLLEGLPGAGIVIALAATSAEAVAVPLQVTTTTTSAPAPQTPLARTGGELSLLPLLAGGLAVTAVAARRAGRRATSP